MTIAIDFRDQDGERFLHVSAMLKSAAECHDFIAAMTLAKSLLAPADAEPLPKFIGALAPAEDTQRGRSDTARKALGTVSERGPVEPVVGAAGPVVGAKPAARTVFRAAEIVATLWPTGQAPKQIAAAAGVSESRVYQIAKKLNLPARHLPTKAPPVIDEQEAERRAEVRRIITEMWADGGSTRSDIAARVGLSAWSVTRIAREIGLPHRSSVRETNEITNASRAPAAAAEEEERAGTEPTAAATILSEESREEPTAELPAENSASPAPKPEASPVPDAGPATAVTLSEAQRGQADKPTAPAPRESEPQTSAQATFTNAAGAVQGRSEPAAPPSNGHAADMGRLLVQTDGIALHEHAIEFGVRSIDVTPMECRALTVMLRAAPSAISADFVRKRAWPSSARVQDAENELAIVCKSLRERLPEIGLELWVGKGVGMAIRPITEQAA